MEEYLYSLLSAAINHPLKWGYFSDGESLPRVTMMHVSGSRFRTQTSKGLMFGSIQVDCWGKTYAQAAIASREVRGVLEGHSGGPIVSVGFIARRDGNSDGTEFASRVSQTFRMSWRD